MVTSPCVRSPKLSRRGKPKSWSTKPWPNANSPAERYVRYHPQKKGFLRCEVKRGSLFRDRDRRMGFPGRRSETGGVESFVFSELANLSGEDCCVLKALDCTKILRKVLARGKQSWVEKEMKKKEGGSRGKYGSRKGRSPTHSTHLERGALAGKTSFMPKTMFALCFRKLLGRSTFLQTFLVFSAITESRFSRPSEWLMYGGEISLFVQPAVMIKWRNKLHTNKKGQF